MEIECFPAGKQDFKIDNLVLYNNITSKVYNTLLGKVEIIKGSVTKYKIEYSCQDLEFKHDELLNERKFNTKCLAKGLPLVPVWIPFINEAINRAVVVDETDYEPNVKAARDYCAFLLRKEVKDDIGTDGTQLMADSGFFYCTEHGVHHDRCKLDYDLLNRILVKNGVKVGENQRKTPNYCFNIWKLNRIKLKEFAGY